VTGEEGYVAYIFHSPTQTPPVNLQENKDQIQRMASMAVNLPACSFGWWLMTSADLF
jgi:hypothetical protein